MAGTIRLHLSAGETKEIIGRSDRPVVIASFSIDTDGVNDSILKIWDKNGPYLPITGFTVYGPQGSSIAVTSPTDVLVGPAFASLDNGTAVIKYFEV